MKLYSIISILTSAILLSACGGSDGDSSTSEPPQEPTAFDGTYNLVARSTTPFDINGNLCGSAVGTMNVNISVISGSVIDSWGNTFDLSGDVSASGDVFGGFALSGSNNATFEGSFSGNTGSGTWEDIYQCEGTWEVTVQDSSEEPTAFDGTYNLVARSTTPFDVNGNLCGSAVGAMNVNISVISGSVIDTWGNTFDLSGVVSASGDVFGGFALSGSNGAIFNGSLSGNSGSGTWVDIYQCEGTWEATFQDSSEEPTAFDGTYNIVALSTTPDINGNPCGNAFGTMNVNISMISGSVIDTWGNTFDLSGVVSASGDVFGGFALSGSNGATFNGSLSGNPGSGTWVDIYQCEGTWEATIN